jgi:DeoR family transcriptional regulator of aga operon
MTTSKPPLDNPMPLMTNQRRQEIVSLLRQQGALRVADLATRFGVSQVTIRNDLASLERQGELVRDRGGAAPVTDARRVTDLLAVDQRASLQMEQKKRIARAAAALIQPGETILLDAGTTVVEMVPYLENIPRLTIVTNALNVALQMGARGSAQVILLGGSYHQQSSSVLGPLAERTLAEIRVDRFFLGAQAFDSEHGLTDTTLEIAQFKKAASTRSRQIILLADSAKWGSTGFVNVMPLQALQTIITDTGLPKAAESAIRSLGPTLTIV